MLSTSNPVYTFTQAVDIPCANVVVGPVFIGSTAVSGTPSSTNPNFVIASEDGTVNDLGVLVQWSVVGSTTGQFILEGIDDLDGPFNAWITGKFSAGNLHFLPGDKLYFSNFGNPANGLSDVALHIVGTYA
jgi:hypothetical protein